MNALIDLNNCREFMTIRVNDKAHKIQLTGTVEDPYFCARDVCNILGYKDPKEQRS